MDLTRRGAAIRAAMSLAPLAHVLFTRVMKYGASKPDLGRTATASCSPQGMPRSCSTPCCISLASGSRSTTSRTSASGGQRRRDTPRLATPPALR